MLQIPTLSTCPRYWRSERRRHGNFKFPAGADRSGWVTMQALRHQFIPDSFQSQTMPNGLDRGGWGATKIVTASNLKDCEITKCVTGRKLLEKICISLMKCYQSWQSFVRSKVQFEIEQRQSWKWRPCHLSQLWDICIQPSFLFWDM